MPSVNLRLTGEQHRVLAESAASQQRSLQREIIFRLFGGAVTYTEPVLSERDQAGRETPAGMSGELAAVPAGDQSTRPESPQRSDPPRSESSRCSAATPYGTRCKTCGKVHTW
jgi:hypothetical protein